MSFLQAQHHSWRCNQVLCVAAADPVGCLEAHVYVFPAGPCEAPVIIDYHRGPHRVSINSVRSACDLDEMVAKLSLHGAVCLTDFGRKHDVLELRNHLSLTEFAKVPALSTRWAE